MRKVPVLIAAAALLVAALPSAASAHAAIRYTNDETYIQCERLTGPSGSLSFGAAASPDYGTDAALLYWADPLDPDIDPPTWVSAGAEVALAPDGLRLTGTIDLYEWLEPEPEPTAIAPNAVEPTGPYVGQATVDIVLEASGDPQPFSESSGKGTNQQVRYAGTEQWFAASGEIVLPGELVFSDLSSCLAVHEIVNVFATQPDAFVSRGDAITLGCEWISDDWYAYLNAYGESGWSSADLFVSTAEGDYYGGGEATLTSTAFSAGFDLYSVLPPELEAIQPDATGGGEFAGTVDASATLASTGQHLRYMENGKTTKFKVLAQVLGVNGSLALSLPGLDVTLAMDDAVCSAAVERIQTIQTSPSAQLHGKPLPNDLPENATPIAVGDSVSVRSTVGTDYDPEAPCTYLDPDLGPVDLPIGHTAWWTFEGTGGDVTVDTAGSTFDTIVGIYTYDGESYAQVACGDDVETPEGYSLQAAVTIGTDAGLTYYIQAGGFAGEAGRLELALS